MHTQALNNIFKPRKFLDFFVALHQTTYSHVGPHTATQALKILEWCDAMSIEFNAFIKNDIWKLFSSSSHQNVGCKWLLWIKRRPNGSIDRYKAHLVAK